MRGDELGKLRRACDVCGARLTHPAGPGRPRRYCSRDCARDAELAQRRAHHAEARFRATLARLEHSAGTKLGSG